MTQGEFRQKLADLIHDARIDQEIGVADFLLADEMIDLLNEYRSIASGN